MTPASDLPAHEAPANDRDARYRDVRATYGGALARLAAGYERDADARRDLLQEIHVALWRSLATFDGRCSLRTWVYRVAHNVAFAHLERRRRDARAELVDIESIEDSVEVARVDTAADDRRAVARLLDLVQQLAPLDRQLMLLYLEGFEPAEIADVVGLRAGAVATRVHRIKRLLRQRLGESS